MKARQNILESNRNGKGRWEWWRVPMEDAGRGRLTVVNSLKGIVGGVKDPLSEVLHSLRPCQLLGERRLPGAGR